MGDSDGESKIGQLGAGRGKTPESFIGEFKGAVMMYPKNVEAYVKANPDKADDFKKAIQGIKDAEKELQDWIETKPERNDENMQKFQAFQKKIGEAKAELEKFSS